MPACPRAAEGGAYALVGMAVGDNFLLAAELRLEDAAGTLPFAIFVNTIAPPGAGHQGTGPA